ncbi:MAG: hypothetical protein Q7T11_02130 [Deltaproteobacteria bacterium]|nr:hypothetical protein [Deltaproteobacteria bacterium]
MKKENCLTIAALVFCAFFVLHASHAADGSAQKMQLTTGYQNYFDQLAMIRTKNLECSSMKKVISKSRMDLKKNNQICDESGDLLTQSQGYSRLGMIVQDIHSATYTAAGNREMSWEQAGACQNFLLEERNQAFNQSDLLRDSSSKKHARCQRFGYDGPVQESLYQILRTSSFEYCRQCSDPDCTDIMAGYAIPEAPKVYPKKNVSNKNNIPASIGVNTCSDEFKVFYGDREKYYRMSDICYRSHEATWESERLSIVVGDLGRIGSEAPAGPCRNMIQAELNWVLAISDQAEKLADNLEQRCGYHGETVGILYDKLIESKSRVCTACDRVWPIDAWSEHPTYPDFRGCY